MRIETLWAQVLIFLKRLASSMREYVRLPVRRLTTDPSKLVTSINESAKSVATQSLTLLVTAAYAAVTAAGLTDSSFVLRDRVTLPIVNASIPVRSFFLLAPALLLTLHVTVLLQEYFLLQKIAQLPWKRADIDSTLFHPSISLGNHFPKEYWFLVGLLVRVVFWSFLFIMPLAVLVYLQTSSLRYRVDSTKVCLWICTFIDLAASLVFIFVSDLIKRDNLRLWPGRQWRSGVKFVLLVVFAGWFTISYARQMRFYDQCTWEQDEKFLKIFSIRRHLILNDESLSSKIPEGALDDLTISEPANPHTRGRGVDFRRQDLRCADFMGARLVKADFRGAKLNGALFDGADLRSADFSVALFSGPRPPQASYRPVELIGASFVDADLSRANLAGADLRRAVFDRAVLRESNLSDVDLAQGSAIRANLVAADLTNARLRGADFREARLEFATLDDAKIELARFESAHLDRASFAGAATFGASFQNAWLRGVRGLTLQGVSLRSSKVWGLNSCDLRTDSTLTADPAHFPEHIDLRYLVFDQANWQDLRDELVLGARTPFTKPILKRMEAALPMPEGQSDPTCFVESTLAAIASRRPWPRVLKERNILYDLPRPKTFSEGWPAQSPLTEEDYELRLIRNLIQKACADNPRTPPTLWTLLEKRAEEIDRFGQVLRQQLKENPCK